MAIDFRTDALADFIEESSLLSLSLKHLSTIGIQLHILICAFFFLDFLDFNRRLCHLSSSKSSLRGRRHQNTSHEDHIARAAHSYIRSTSDEGQIPWHWAHGHLISWFLNSDLLIRLEERILRILHQLPMSLICQAVIALAGLNWQERSWVNNLEILRATLLTLVGDHFGRRLHLSGTSDHSSEADQPSYVSRGDMSNWHWLLLVAFSGRDHKMIGSLYFRRNFITLLTTTLFLRKACVARSFFLLLLLQHL